MLYSILFYKRIFDIRERCLSSFVAIIEKDLPTILTHSLAYCRVPFTAKQIPFSCFFSFLFFFILSK
ncbi:hypothetical protein IC582_006894 [Cucumis melo]